MYICIYVYICMYIYIYVYICFMFDLIDLKYLSYVMKYYEIYSERAFSSVFT